MNSQRLLTAVADFPASRRLGRLTRLSSSYVEADGPPCKLGELCEIELDDGRVALAEAAAVHDGHVVLLPLEPVTGLSPGARVLARGLAQSAGVGDAFKGRAIDGLGRALDDAQAPIPEKRIPLQGLPPAPLDRADAPTMLSTGVRAIDALSPIGAGQRLGVFAASGVGKTTLVRQLARQVECDHCIVCLIGERGREVEDAWRELSARQPHRFSLVAATSDQSAPLRVRAAQQALCLGEHWRAEGAHVLLIFDSITRYAMALREVGLAGGEPPALRAYTPNVFAALARLVERCGGVKSGGAITAIMTILCETDDGDDPIAETMRSLLDGHFVLSRELSERGQFPAIDVLASLSRRAGELMDGPHSEARAAALRLLSIYDEAKIMIESGVYKSGSNSALDEAIRMRPALLGFLAQRADEHAPIAETLSGLRRHAPRRGAHG